MASSLLLLSLALLLLLSSSDAVSAGAPFRDSGLAFLREAPDWALAGAVYGLEEEDERAAAFGEAEEDEGAIRRSLYWGVRRYYISYGALSANRIPCPPRSGRSYYTHNCYRARGPVHPYHRGCSRITMCRNGAY